MTDQTIPAGWTIEYSPKPIPSHRFDFDFDFWHDDYDGTEATSHLQGTSPSRADAIEQIKYIEAESNIS